MTGLLLSQALSLQRREHHIIRAVADEDLRDSLRNEPVPKEPDRVGLLGLADCISIGAYFTPAFAKSPGPGTFPRSNQVS